MNSTSGVRVAVNAALIFAGKAFASIAFIALFVIVSRSYPVEEYGTFRQVWMICKDLSVGCFAFGVPMGILYFLSRLKHERKHRFVLQSVLLLALLGLSAAVLIRLTTPLLVRWFDNPDLARSLALFAVYPIILLPTLALESVFISFEKARYYSAFLILSKLGLLAAVIVSVSLEVALDTLLQLILGFATLELLASLSMIYHFSSTMRGESAGVSLRRQLAYSAPVGLSAAVGILNVELDKFVVGLRLGVGEFAFYANGAVVIPFIGTLAGAATSALMPHLVSLHADGATEEALDLWQGTVLKLMLIFFPLIGFLLVFAAEFITLLFSTAYLDSVPVFRVYLMAQLPKIIFFSPFLMAIGRNRAPLNGAVIGLVANALMSWLFVSWFGLVGPAIATLIANYLVTGYYIRSLTTALDTHPERTFPFRAGITIFVASVAIAWLVREALGFGGIAGLGPIGLGASFLLQFALVALLAVKLGLLTRNDLLFLRHFSNSIAGRSS